MNIKAILKGAVISVVILLLILIIVSVINCFAEMGEKPTRIILLLGMCVSIAVSAYGVSSNCDKKKLINSLCMGVLVVACLCAVSLLVNHGISGVRFITAFICCMASSAFGTFISK